MTNSPIQTFITRWLQSGGSEQANSQMFLTELCSILELPQPEPAKAINEENVYSFERKVFVPASGSKPELKRLDIYHQGSFVLEAKQGRANNHQPTLPGLTISKAVVRGSRSWEETMAGAKRQGEHYIRCLPADEGRPPVLIVADVGYCFDIYAEFTCTGGLYLPFPDVRNNRIHLADLAKPEVQEFFKALWLNPLCLDPSRRAAEVTEKIAANLAELAKLLEADRHDPEEVAAFLMRALFSMFAEDVGLIPQSSFQHILEKALKDPSVFAPLLDDLWRAMNSGGFSVYLSQKLLQFNGNLFANPKIMVHPVNAYLKEYE